MKLRWWFGALCLLALVMMGGQARGGAGGCTICRLCPSGTVCFPGGTPVSVCDELGCKGIPTDTSDLCGVSPGSGANCPDSESGLCSDGVNNDAWVDGLTDCADPDCAGDPACGMVAPALSSTALGGLAFLLLGISAWQLRRRGVGPR